MSSIFSRLGKKLSDGLVGVSSGSTPVGALDTPRAFQGILVLGIIALGVGGWIIFHSITTLTAPVKVNTKIATTNTDAVAELNKLKTKDTDGDTLSDYDELYNLHTSPYLKDSDGDGVPDNVELSKGADPNCPSGKVCEGFRLLTSVTDAKGALTPAFLRRALASAGVPQATLDKTDDASLLSIYNQVLKSQPATNTNSSTNTNRATNTNIPSIANTNSADAAALQEIQSLDPAEIRQLLLQNGVDQATLNQVDDATLSQIFAQAIASNK